MALNRGGAGTAINTITYTSAGGKTERLDIPAVMLVDSTGTAPGVAATEATLAAASAKLPATLGAKTAAGSMSVVAASDSGMLMGGSGIALLDAQAFATNSSVDAGGTTRPFWCINSYYNGTTIDVVRGNTAGAFAVNRPDTTGGLSTSRIVTGNTGFIKASVGQVYKITAYNVNAAVRYLHLYNKASAPTLSTDTPIITIPLLGASVREIDLSNLGATFATGIAWAYTTDDIAIPTTAGTSAELHATVFYK